MQRRRAGSKADRTLDDKSVAGKAPAVDEHCRLLVVGAGTAGVSAALEGVRLGLSVVLVDENPVPAETMGDDVPLHFGQRMSGAVRNRSAMLEAMVAGDERLAEAVEKGVDIRLGTIVHGLWTNGPSVGWLDRPVAGLADGERAWLLGFERAVIAAGSRDMGLAFPGWELPGVMGAAAAERLLRLGALSARRAVVLGSSAEALSTALALDRAGVEVAAIVECAAAPIGPRRLVKDAGRAGIPLRCGHVVRSAEGGADGITSIVLAGRVPGGGVGAGKEERIACDTIVLGIGRVPAIELLDAAGCHVAFDPRRGGHVPLIDGAQQTSVPILHAAGDCVGIWQEKSLDAAIAAAEGRTAARHAARALGCAVECADAAAKRPRAPRHDFSAYRLDWVRATIIEGDPHAAAEPLVCQCEEVTAREILEVRPPRYLGAAPSRRNDRDLASLLGNGPPSPDHVKRLTRAGMGLCQGRRCREQVACLLALGAGLPLAEVPHASYRAPVRPLPLRLAAAKDESAGMTKNWEGWFGIPTQMLAPWELEEYEKSRDGGEHK